MPMAGLVCVLTKIDFPFNTKYGVLEDLWFLTGIKDFLANGYLRSIVGHFCGRGRGEELFANHAQAILDVFSIAISDLVSMGLTEQEAISGLLGQASVRVDHPAMELALELHRLYHKDFSKAKI